MKEKRTLIIDVDNKKLIDRETGEILANGCWEINRTLRAFDREETVYTIQVWFQSICPIWADFFVQNYYLTSSCGCVIMAGP